MAHWGFAVARRIKAAATAVGRADAVTASTRNEATSLKIAVSCLVKSDFAAAAAAVRTSA